MWFLTLLLALFALTGCETSDRIQTTEFIPEANGTFRYKGVADALNPIDSQDGEARRMRMLDEWMHLNSACQNGYKITSRQPVLRNMGIVGKGVYDVWYEGRCT